MGKSTDPLQPTSARPSGAERQASDASLSNNNETQSARSVTQEWQAAASTVRAISSPELRLKETSAPTNNESVAVGYHFGIGSLIAVCVGGGFLLAAGAMLVVLRKDWQQGRLRADAGAGADSDSDGAEPSLEHIEDITPRKSLAEKLRRAFSADRAYRREARAAGVDAKVHIDFSDLKSGFADGWSDLQLFEGDGDEIQSSRGAPAECSRVAWSTTSVDLGGAQSANANNIVSEIAAEEITPLPTGASGDGHDSKQCV